MTRPPTEADFPLYGPWDDPGEPAGSVVFGLSADGRALMQLRDDRPDVVHGGRWCPFGGGVEGDETLIEAAVREFEEETGLRLAPDALAPLGRALSTTPRRTRLYAFTAGLAAAGPEAIRLGEGAGFAFLTPRQLRSVDVVPSLRAMAWAVADRLDGR